MRQKILFVFDSLGVGGSTSALLSMLNSIDYTQYEVDLLLQTRQGEFLDSVPKEVRILEVSPDHGPGACCPMLRALRLMKQYIASGTVYTRFLYEINKRRGTDTIQLAQRIAISRAKSMKPLDGEYDVAIGFMELWSSAYTALKVKANRKIAWMHVDYIGANLNSSTDRPIYDLFDAVVTVSEQCRRSFVKCFPEYSHKTYFLENIVSDTFIRKRAEAPSPEIDDSYKGLTIVTVCRLHNRHKGLDRAVKACRKLVDVGVDLRWYVIGEGPDRDVISEQIRACKLEGIFMLLGVRKNPYPYVRKADLFALPSRYEGKPIVVTEAHILACPVIVTNYASAMDQVDDGVNGLVVANNDEDFVDGMVRVCTDRRLVDTMRANLSGFKIDNQSGMDNFYSLINADFSPSADLDLCEVRMASVE